MLIFFFSSYWRPVSFGWFSFTGFGFSLSQPVTAPVLLVFVMFEFGVDVVPLSFGHSVSIRLRRKLERRRRGGDSW